MNNRNKDKDEPEDFKDTTDVNIMRDGLETNESNRNVFLNPKVTNNFASSNKVASEFST